LVVVDTTPAKPTQGSLCGDARDAYLAAAWNDMDGASREEGWKCAGSVCSIAGRAKGYSLVFSPDGMLRLVGVVETPAATTGIPTASELVNGARGRACRRP